MQAMLSRESGAPLVLETADVPTPGPGDALVEITAAGVNFADMLMTADRYQNKFERPFAPGMEVAGRIRAVGEDVALPAGSRVVALLGQGGFAEQTLARAALIRPLPDDVADEIAAVLPVAFGSTLIALKNLAQAKAGERLLVTGAAGGVGLAAVEIGKLLGLEVIAAARGPAKLALAQGRGADHLIDTDRDDLRAAVKSLGGADIVYDPVGGAIWDAALRATAPGARLLPLGFAGGAVPQIPADYLLVKNLSVFGFWLGGFVERRPDAFQDAMRTLLGWVSAGRLTPQIDEVLALGRANEALARLKDRSVLGKIVLRPDGANKEGPP